MLLVKIGCRLKSVLLLCNNIIPVINVRDVEIILGPVVRRTKNHFLQYSFSGLCHLDVEIVITDHTEQEAIAINAIVSHHLFYSDFPGTSALVRDILNEI